MEAIRNAKKTETQQVPEPEKKDEQLNISEDLFASSDEEGDLAAALDAVEKGEPQKEKVALEEEVKNVKPLRQRTLLEMLDECYTKDNESPSKKRCIVKKSSENIDS